jgi:hypothetical protein
VRLRAQEELLQEEIVDETDEYVDNLRSVRVAPDAASSSQASEASSAAPPAPPASPRQRDAKQPARPMRRARSASSLPQHEEARGVSEAVEGNTREDGWRRGGGGMREDGELWRPLLADTRGGHDS